MAEVCRTHAEFWLQKLKEREHSEDLDRYGKMILKWIFKKLIKRAWDYSPDLKNKGPATQNAVCRRGLRSLSAAECYILSRLF